MKKIKLVAAALLIAGLGLSTANAQDAGATKSTKNEAKVSPNKPNTPSHMKKDGTPDMRYKENKQAAAATTTTTTKTKATTNPAPKKSGKTSTKSTEGKTAPKKTGGAK